MTLPPLALMRNRSTAKRSLRIAGDHQRAPRSSAHMHPDTLDRLHRLRERFGLDSIEATLRRLLVLGERGA